MKGETMFKDKVFWRRLIVRAIEDAFILFCICVSIAVVCMLFSRVFAIMGVA